MKSSVVIFLVVSLLICAGYISADQRCGRNAAPATCGSVCEPTCINPKPKICPETCELNGCRCNEGYVRDENTKKCVRYNQCTKQRTPVA